jgi:hypothetical protein
MQASQRARLATSAGMNRVIHGCAPRQLVSESLFSYKNRGGTHFLHQTPRTHLTFILAASLFQIATIVRQLPKGNLEP